MKKFVSVGLVARASSMQAADAPLSEPGAKLWNISATLRGFYDDNIDTSPTGTPKNDGYGYELSPSVNWHWRRDQTTIKLGYTYSYIYYDSGPKDQNHKYDQDHLFTGTFHHTFSERLSMEISDNFVVGQEPDTLRTGNALTAVQHISGNNIRNTGSIVFNLEVTRLLAFELGYANSYFNYEADANDEGGPFPFFPPSPSGTSDRIEHYAHLDSRWTISRQTTGVIGYQYEQVDYTGNEAIGLIDVDPGPGTILQTVNSDVRNSRTHKAYVGFDHRFRPDFAASVRIGGTYNDAYNEQNSSSDFAPYVNLSLSYVYAPESMVQGGFTYDRNTTDVTGGSEAKENVTQDAQSATIFGTLRHRIFPGLYATLNGQFQYSSFNGGDADGMTEKYYLISTGLEYRINRFISASAGYSYNKVDSELNRSYDRNRVYIGLTAGY